MRRERVENEVIGVKRGDHISQTGGSPRQLAAWQQVANSLPAALLLMDGEDVVIVANAQASRFLGPEDAPLMGTDIDYAAGALTDAHGSPVSLKSAVNRVRSTTGPVELRELYLERGARRIEVAVSILPSGEEGVPNVTIAIAEPDDAHGEASARDVTLSMVSHELRTPLLHIKGFVSSLLESDIEWDEETKLDFLRTIDREADRLTAMVSDLSQISRMGTGDFPLHLETASPWRLAYAALDEASPFLRRHRAVVSVPEEMREVRLDVLRVMGVLVNLIENATKYSPEGSTITISATGNDSEVVFSVSDQGKGVLETDARRIFDMFFRAESSKKTPNGSGLGLAVCKAVVDAHGGAIWVESDGACGSQFYFSIPRTKDADNPGGRKKVWGARKALGQSERVASSGD